MHSNESSSLGHSRITVAMIQMNASFALEKRIEYITVAVLLPPRAQLSIPHTVQVIDERRMLVTNQRVVILVAQMSFEFIFIGNVLHLFGSQQIRVQFRFAYTLKIDENYTRIQTWIAMLSATTIATIAATIAIVFLVMFADAVASRRQVVWITEVSVWIFGTILIEYVTIHRCQFGR